MSGWDCSRDYGIGVLEIIVRLDWLWTTTTGRWHLPSLEWEWNCKPTIFGRWHFCSKWTAVIFSIPYYLLKPYHFPIRGGMYFPSSLSWMSSFDYSLWLSGWMGYRENDPLWLLRWWGFHLAHSLGTPSLGPRPHGEVAWRHSGRQPHQHKPALTASLGSLAPPLNRVEERSYSHWDHQTLVWTK